MPIIKQQTTEVIEVTSWSTGQARSSHPGFEQTSTKLPKSDEVWSDYFDGVLRGSTDGYDGSDVTSKTFADTSSTGEGPPAISNTMIGTTTVNGAAGEPAGGFVPTVGSATDGDVTTIPASSSTFITRMSAVGHGTGRNGSVENPKVSSDDQPASSIVANGESPSYILGKYSS